MNVHNIRRLLTYLESLKTQGEEDKWDMSQYLCDRARHEPLLLEEVTNWWCGTAGCFAGSWTILKVKDGCVPPDVTMELIDDFRRDFELNTGELKDHVILGHWSPRGVYATLDEAIDYLRLCLDKGTMEISLG